MPSANSLPVPPAASPEQAEIERLARFARRTLPSQTMMLPLAGASFAELMSLAEVDPALWGGLAFMGAAGAIRLVWMGWGDWRWMGWERAYGSGSGRGRGRKPGCDA